MKEGKIISFTDLYAWQKGHTLVLEIYKITKSFPKEEMYGIIHQLRRAVVSITSNIAEGFTRKTAKEKVQFYRISLSSLTEVQNQLLIARDIGYVSSEDFGILACRTIEITKITNGLIKKTHANF